MGEFPTQFPTAPMFNRLLFKSGPLNCESRGSLMFPLESPTAAAVAVVAASAVYVVFLKFRSTPKLPPGPQGVPLLGNALSIPAEHPWLRFSAWSKTYGDVVSLKALGQSIIILSSSEAVEDLLVKRGAIYSDRPRLVMAWELVGWGKSLPGLGYGERFRQYRKHTSRIIGARGAQSYIPQEEHATAAFLRRLIDSPENFEAHVRWVVAALILRLTYGYNAAERDDHLVEVVETGMANFSLSTTPGWIVDIVPAIRFLPAWLPGMGFLRQARIWSAEATAMIHEPFKFVKSQLESGTARHSFSASMLQGEDGSGVAPHEEDIIMWIAGSLYGGGADTTASSDLSFFLAMTLYPDVQRKAQEEIDALTGGERLPVYADRARLPYIDALVKEIHRWHPIGPLGLPHYVAQADEYRGWSIPAGSIVIANIWHLLHDPEKYPDPMKFDPERYLRAAPPGINEDPKSSAFGFGRRECPGKYIADSSVWLLVAMTLAAFDISKAVDGNGKPITPQENYASGTISHPLPFKCDIKLRSAKWDQLITAERVFTAM
ncbi:cytochrome P450 [Auricularia subglabra TFB-10046 SS5]|uniref:Cytochrome P450 n=1 Tax=Auricularia subglabra (strain TFB-10046 / SS5) TaxID=717982 RepID=J0D182_AURST|nr:cytochrome P450 [Auricularia subglabra TFB-10046 SS5]